MQDQLLSKKQKSVIKITYAITFVMLAFSLIAVFLQALDLTVKLFYKVPYNYLNLITPLLAALLFIFIIANKKSNRKTVIAITYTVLAVINLFFAILSIFTADFTNIQRIIHLPFFLIYGITLLMLSLLLLQKTKGKQIKQTSILAMFIVLICSCIAHSTLSMYFEYNQSIPLFIVFSAAKSIFLLFIAFILYKALTDESFYKNFIERHPKAKQIIYNKK